MTTACKIAASSADRPGAAADNNHIVFGGVAVDVCEKSYWYAKFTVERGITVPNHCSPACNVTAGIPFMPRGAPLTTNELCHSRPFRLCVQIENAPFPLDRPRLEHRLVRKSKYNSRLRDLLAVSCILDYKIEVVLAGKFYPGLDI
jgi:hypothetical protein